MPLRQPATLAGVLVAALCGVATGAVRAAADDSAVGNMPIGTTPAHMVNGVDVVPVAAGIAMVDVHGQNVVVQYGPDGVLVVDSGAPGDSSALLQVVKHLSSEPIRFILNTSASPDRTGGNAQLAQAGHGFSQNESGFGGGRFVGMTNAPVVARLNVLTAMSGSTPGYSQDALPSITYDEGQQNLSLNGDSIEMVPAPSGHSDGDSWVVFRQADVIVSGDTVDMLRFPQIDVAHGGGIDAEVDAMNRLVDIVVPALPLYWHQGGTVLIPARGRLAQAEEVVQYRDMVTMVRDRVQALVAQHRSLAQVKAANPTAGFNNRYGAEDGPWTTDQFVTAVYQSLTASHAHRRGQ
ncbi:MAG TPA: MBL fold metallo-hydrolase [Steroidobacteraceae bacterium]|jgi:glyoxylase-like metal-dependent hydrolase (beta-lactamase superfamily II)|nr:MBL fold metallo-hydrolase [Steroidobacteraceae bacterium]